MIFTRFRNAPNPANINWKSPIIAESSRYVARKSIQAYILSECGNAQATVGNKDFAVNFYRQSIELWKTLKQDKVVTDLEEKIAKLAAHYFSIIRQSKPTLP